MNESPLETVAARLADGETIDWQAAAGAAADDRERRRIGHLQLVETISRTHSGADARPGEPAGVADLPTVSAAPERARTPEEGALIPPVPRLPDEPFPKRWGRLELRERLGGGAFGEVYRAWDDRLDREVALKLLKYADVGEARASAVVEEGRLLAKLRHPNVVTVFGAEIHDGQVGIWMELIRGRSLAQQLREQGPFGPREAAVIGMDLCRALAAVHRVRVVHRDVKPENALREEGGRILLADFGASIEQVDEKQGGLSGTRLYMAPELLRGAPASPRSDIYALGVLLYHLVTGAYPLEARTWDELRAKLARREVKLLSDQRPDLPGPFIQAVERALAMDPESRYETAGHMEKALGAAVGMEQEAPSGPPDAESSPPRRGWLPLAVSGALGAAVLLGGAMIFSGLMRRPPADPAAVEVAPSVASYTVEAALYRVPAGATTRERLDPGARLAVGDNLSLDFEASAPVHVYVINEDDQGHAYALFPLPGFEPQNPLPPGTRHRLPGTRDGKALSWTVDSPGGREHMLILASPQRLVEFEAEMNALARPGQSTVPLPETAKVRLRGLGSLSEAPADTGGSAAAGRLFEMAGRLAAGSEVARGVWMRSIEIENPEVR